MPDRISSLAVQALAGQNLLQALAGHCHVALARRIQACVRVLEPGCHVGAHGRRGVAGPASHVIMIMMAARVSSRSRILMLLARPPSLSPQAWPGPPGRGNRTVTGQ
jgi:hypothetical protein